MEGATKTTMTSNADPTTPIDGRRMRRERGRRAVAEATIDLVLEGVAPPTVEQVAARAGVSVASVFRYFETLDELRNETARRYLDRFAHLIEIPNIGKGSSQARIKRFVDSRLEFYAATEPMARFVRRRAPTVTELDEMLHRNRVTRAAQVRQHFAAELATLSPARRVELVGVICILTSFESWVELRDDHVYGAVQIRRAWMRTLGRLLSEP